MKRLLIFMAAFAACFSAEVQSYLSHTHETEKALIEAIDKESKGIKVAIYTFTNKRIAKALVDAKNRGVDVEVLVDPFSIKIKGAVQVLVDGGVNVYVYLPKEQNCWTALLHHKFCLFESNQGIWTGSYNFTYKAEKSNMENAVLITGDEKSFYTFKKEFEDLQREWGQKVTQIVETAKMISNG